VRVVAGSNPAAPTNPISPRTQGLFEYRSAALGERGRSIVGEFVGSVPEIRLRLTTPRRCSAKVAPCSLVAKHDGCGLSAAASHARDSGGLRDSQISSSRARSDSAKRLSAAPSGSSVRNGRSG